MERFSFPSSTGLCDIAAYRRLPEGEPKAVVQLIHDAAEHSSGFAGLAEYLCSLGCAVYASDLAGHGGSIESGGTRGFFAPTEGWERLLEDVMLLHAGAKREFPSAPQVLYGHSLGSLLARACASRYPDEFAAFVFSGTACRPRALRVIKMLAEARVKALGPECPDERMSRLLFGSFLKRVDRPRTRFDWLSRDEAAVEEYVSDELCGFTLTASGIRDMLTGLEEVSARSWAERVPNVPICLVSGREDPVGAYGRGVVRVCKRLLAAGHTHLVLQLYAGGRHDIHNETDRDEVYRGIAAFLGSSVSI